MSPSWCPYPKSDQSSESFEGLLPIAGPDGVAKYLRICLRQCVVEVLLGFPVFEECRAKSPGGRVEGYVNQHSKMKVSSQIEMSHHRALGTFQECFKPS